MKNFEKPLKWQKTFKNVEKNENFVKPSKMEKHCQKCPERQKCRKTVKKTVKNVEKQLKIEKNSQKTVKIVGKPLKWQ